MREELKRLAPLLILTEAQEEMLRLVAKYPESAANLGARLWGTQFRKPQSYARSAGKLLHYLRRLGLVMFYYDGPRTVWRVVHGGREWLAGHAKNRKQGGSK